MDAQVDTLPENPFGISDALVRLVAEDVARKGYRVLFVDDEPNIVRSFFDMCRIDYAVKTAVSAAEAHKILADGFDPHVIVADQRMADETGVMLFAAVRETNALSVRILCTGYADYQAVIDAINKGQIHRFVAKPVDTPSFMKLLAETVALSVLMRRFSSLKQKGTT